ncbi:cellulose-binding protein [Moniliophthora roreri MCA 2997]|uniref:Cellulose-binding protein n=1 Tax=Moniliophthora roreri (strain MCA 2997) TaxID=1381753 RepID=V2Y825_MONRO|nr:cellulose-binding protein [Moniliophthora roreri MCA 2997]
MGLATLICFALSFTLAIVGSAQRVFVLTDISNEPDDTMSLVRFLLYSNEFDVEGIVATTSTWLRNTTAPDQIKAVMNAYGEVLSNLNVHAAGYPSLENQLSKVRSGLPVYGLQGVGEGKDSEGSDLLIEVADKEDPEGRPLWVPTWGGANVLAQALWKVSNTRSPEEVKKFVSKLRVYTISDQDDSGVWIRRNYPDLFYIVSIHAFSAYDGATWGGISTPTPGADQFIVSPEWLKTNIQIGPYGKMYPDIAFIMEGDTPSFLYLIPNGLGVPEQPSYGTWGGRYESIDGISSIFSDVADTVVSKVDGNTYTTNRATIWRWREAFQNDFAARMQWTLSSNFSACNHQPIVIVNGQDGTLPVEISAKGGETITVDASESHDPDAGDELSFNWFQYKEPSSKRASGDGGPAAPDFDFHSTQNSTSLQVTIPEGIKQGTYHIILEVSDSGTPKLFRYRRVLITAA